MKRFRLPGVRRSGWLALGLFAVSAQAQTILGSQYPQMTIGTTVSDVGGRLQVIETATGAVFGPGRTGTVDVQLSNVGTLNSVGWASTGCWGTMTATPVLPDVVRFNVTAGPASAPTEPCALSANVGLLGTGASPGPVIATIVAGTLPGITVGANTPFGNWTNGLAAISLAGSAVPAAGYAGGETALPDMDITEFSLGAMYANFTDVVILTLPPDYAWVDAGSRTMLNPTMSSNPPAIDGSDPRRLIIDWMDPSNLPPDGIVRLSGQRIRAPAGASGPVLVVASVPIQGSSPAVGSGLQVATISAAPAGGAVGIPVLGGLELGALSVLLAGLGGWARRRQGD